MAKSKDCTKSEHSILPPWEPWQFIFPRSHLQIIRMKRGFLTHQDLYIMRTRIFSWRCETLPLLIETSTWRIEIYTWRIETFTWRIGTVTWRIGTFTWRTNPLYLTYQGPKLAYPIFSTYRVTWNLCLLCRRTKFQSSVYIINVFRFSFLVAFAFQQYCLNVAECFFKTIMFKILKTCVI